jgi:hypothetical protein
MSKPARLAATEKSRERIVVIDLLRQQMLDLEALRREVADAEMRANLGRDFNSRPERRRPMSRNRIERNRHDARTWRSADSPAIQPGMN